jgi:ABC-type multidrug transport system permease subunit
MIKKLANEFVKNIRLMFRNWVSLSLLIIAPLVLILLIGYAFSSQDITGINVGIAADGNVGPFVADVEKYGSVYQYKAIESCIADMKLERVHICLEVSGIPSELKPGEIPSGSVVYHYDNTRQALSLSLVKKIQDYFGLRAEEISIQSAQAILQNIQNLVGFIQDRKADIDTVRNESINLRAQLVERQQKLEGLRDDFLPTYDSLKAIQTQLHNSTATFYNSTDELETSLKSLNSSLYLISSLNLTNVTSSAVESALMSLSSTKSDMNETVFMIDSAVAEVDAIKLMLDDEIKLNQEMISKIDISVQKIDEASKELDAKMAELSKLRPDLAEKLVKPIVNEYEKILEDVSNIQINFPMLAVIIIMFISLLFANIATLMELNDRAYFRNLLAPVDDIVYTIGLAITSTVIIFLQVLVLFAVAQMSFGIDIMSIFWQMSLVSVLLIVFFVLLGMLFAYLFKSVQTSILVTTFTLIVFFLFGNTLSFIEAMPPLARALSQYNPVVMAQYLFKEIQLFGTPLSSLAGEIVLLLVYIAALAVLVFLLAKYKNMQR